MLAQHVELEEQRKDEQDSEKVMRADKLAMVDNLLWNADYLNPSGSRHSCSRGERPLVLQTLQT
jgi:hypothetical protein